jgi:hypothetical protein
MQPMGAAAPTFFDVLTTPTLEHPAKPTRQVSYMARDKVWSNLALLLGHTPTMPLLGPIREHLQLLLLSFYAISTEVKKLS